ncbi:unnamed protein product [Adineta steineri]|uniref:Uncharacterized protein n=1 Tax=Adineta steineri TaxID=433720 RepID=A0A819BZW0_9BILA|nr:unnamed protein product [Adineta steineri]CAF3806212.1 unnamed protein product [Adineta steineri]
MVGFRIQNIDSIKSIFICPKCLLLLRDPVQLINCGHRLCQSCIDEQKGNMIICGECFQKTSREKVKLDRGFRNDMQTLLIVCILCNWTDILKKYQDHLDEIHPNPICAYCEEKFLTVNDINRHLQYDCEKIPVYCPMKEFGCEQIILRFNLNEHYRSEQHQMTLMNVFHHLKTSDHPINASQLTLENHTNQLQDIVGSINILSDSIQILNEDQTRLNTESIHCQNTLDHLTQDVSTVKKSIQEQNAFLNGTIVNHGILQQDIQSMGQKVLDMNTNTNNGIFIWIIRNVQTRMDEARSGKQTSIYSSPFYSSSTGYKMCLSLYLNGDGNARQTHISLFFVLMRGEYDAILKFPFHYKVIFCLYDQTDTKNHIIDSFRPDIKSNSFQRPTTDMNTASGIPKFVPLTIFQQEKNPYVLNDTMFINVMIDYNNTPKTLLPYVFNINPGLTIPIQQTMIRKEVEKQQQTSMNIAKN